MSFEEDLRKYNVRISNRPSPSRWITQSRSNKSISITNGSPLGRGYRWSKSHKGKCEKKSEKVDFRRWKKLVKMSDLSLYFFLKIIIRLLMGKQ